MHEQDAGSMLRWAGAGLVAVGLAAIALLLAQDDPARAHFALPVLGLAAGLVFLLMPAGRERRQQASALAASDARFRIVASATSDAIWDWDLLADHIAWNDGLRTQFGYSAEEAEGPAQFWIERLHPDDRDRVVAGLRGVQQGRGDEWQDEYRFRRRDGDYAVVLDRGTVIRDGAGTAVRMVGGMSDLTERRRAERLDAGQRAILTGIAARAPLSETLVALARLYEALHPGSLCSILLLDETGEHIRHGAAPSLPASYNAGIEGVAIGPCAGSCGTAAWRGERVVVADIANDPLWRDYAALAQAHGLAACWSTPVLSSRGKVLATFAVYYRQPRRPTPEELAAVDNLAAMTAIAIEQGENLGRLQLLERAVESSASAIVIADAQQAGQPVIFVNAAFERITGYRPDEAMGRNCRFLQGPETQQEELDLVRHAIATGTDCNVILRNYRKDGELFWNHVYLSPVRGEAGRVTHYLGVLNDLTERRQVEAELAYAASHDAVTGLPRYPVLESMLANWLAEPGAHAAVYFIDLDRFHAINESMGHVFGDEALHIVAGRLRDTLGVHGQVARFAGDEFVAICRGHDEDVILATARRLREAVSRPIEGDGYRLQLTASVGISRAPQHGRSAMDLLRRAEAAMTGAKRQGRDAICEFSSEQMQEMEDRLLLGARLREAPRRGELEVHYQPLIEAGGRRLVGFEALLRWSNPQLGRVSPARFIPIAEALGLMGEIGHWVIDEACRQMREWQDAGHDGFTVAVNFSAQELQHPDIVSVVRAAVERHGIEPSRLEIELTESSLMEHVDRVVAVMGELKQLGVRLSLDDFGTGYSSLAYLKRFSLDKIKIDRTFVRDLPQDADDAAIARTIVVIGHQLRLKVVAEGVETAEQEAFLRAMGCDQLQGYLFSPPVPAAQAVALLEGRPRK